MTRGQVGLLEPSSGPARWLTIHRATFDAVRQALVGKGFQVVCAPFDEKGLSFLKSTGVEVVFIGHLEFGRRALQAHVCALLEAWELNYVGSSFKTQVLGLDKVLTKHLLTALGIATPAFQQFRSKQERLDRSLRFPLIVKPVSEGQSVGLTSTSVVTTETEVYREVTRILREFHQPALVEEYLDGREFTVGVIGNHTPQVLPLCEINFSALASSVKGPRFYSESFKAKDAVPISCPAAVSPFLGSQLAAQALRVFSDLQCRDLVRIDIRLDYKDHPCVLEVNTSPGMKPDFSDFPRMALTAGLSYEDLIERLIREASARRSSDPE